MENLNFQIVAEERYSVCHKDERAWLPAAGVEQSEAESEWSSYWLGPAEGNHKSTSPSSHRNRRRSIPGKWL